MPLLTRPGRPLLRSALAAPALPACDGMTKRPNRRGELQPRQHCLIERHFQGRPVPAHSLVTGSPDSLGRDAGSGTAPGGVDLRAISIVAEDAATPRASAPKAQGTPFRSVPRSRSKDTGPGPFSASTVSAAIRTALYSHPPFVTQGPLGRCTLRMAVVITPMSAALANGVPNPSASKAPPVVSVTPAASAFRRAGCMASDCIIAAVPSRPGPPNQPFNFWVPCPMKRPPISPRAASVATVISNRPVSAVLWSRGLAPIRRDSAGLSLIPQHGTPR